MDVLSVPENKSLPRDGVADLLLVSVRSAFKFLPENKSLPRDGVADLLLVSVRSAFKFNPQAIHCPICSSTTTSWLSLESLAVPHSPEHGLHRPTLPGCASFWMVRGLHGELLRHCRALSRRRAELSGF